MHLFRPAPAASAVEERLPGARVMGKPTGTGSVLANLTAQVMTEKKTAARTLTPVAGEFPSAEPATPTWPSDLNGPDQPKGFMSHESMTASAKDLRRHADTLIEIADALDAFTQHSTKPSILTLLPDEKAKERAADERIAAQQAAEVPGTALPNQVEDEDDEEFPDRMARLAAEAQAATFTGRGPVVSNVAVDDEPSPVIAAAQAAADAGGGPAEVMAAAMAAEVWACPVHEKQGIEKTSPKTGATFIGCPDCHAFKR